MVSAVSRRRMLQNAAVAFSVLSTSSGRSAAPRVLVRQIRAISLESGYYNGWPTLARCRSGQLLLVYSGGREAHVCPFGRVEIMTSQDSGATWTHPRVLLDSAIDDRDAGVMETAKGTILVTTFTSLAYQPILERAEKDGNWPADRLSRWRSLHARLTDEQRQADLGEWMLRSTDSGLTFSARYACPVNSPHGPIQLADGRLLYAGKELWHGEKRVGVCESSDDGLTWKWLAAIPMPPSTTSFMPLKPTPADSLFTFEITTRPTPEKRCNANRPTGARPGPFPMPSVSGDCRRTYCD